MIASWSDGEFCFILANRLPGGVFNIDRFGVERQSGRTQDEFILHLSSLGLKPSEASFMLRTEQYQLLHISSPSVAPDELKSAARYQIREMIESHIDDVTIDVMRVGPVKNSQASSPNLFVVAAQNKVLKKLMGLSEKLAWGVSVIDVQEMSQRNMQAAQTPLLALNEGSDVFARATLMVIENQQVVMTINVGDELCYSRCFELPAGFLVDQWRHDAPDNFPPRAQYRPVEEYVPEYVLGGVVHGNDYTPLVVSPDQPSLGGSVNDERAQRFLVEVQRSLDSWDRSWSHIPLKDMSVYAGSQSKDLAVWLESELGQVVRPLEINSIFPGFSGGVDSDRDLCAPLFGTLLRVEALAF